MDAQEEDPEGAMRAEHPSDPGPVRRRLGINVGSLLLVLGGCFNPPTGDACVPQPPNWCNPSGWCVYKLVPWYFAAHRYNPELQPEGGPGLSLASITGTSPSNVWVTQLTVWADNDRPFYHWNGCHWTHRPRGDFGYAESKVRASTDGEVWGLSYARWGRGLPALGRLVGGEFEPPPPGLPEDAQPWEIRLDGKHPFVTAGWSPVGGFTNYRFKDERWELLPHQGQLHWGGDRAQVFCQDGSCYVVQDGIRHVLNGVHDIVQTHWAGPNALFIANFPPSGPSFWNGETVEPLPLPPVVAFHGIAADKVVAVSLDQVHIWDGKTWETEDLPGQAGGYYPGISSVWVAPTGHIWLTAGPHVYVRQFPL